MDVVRSEGQQTTRRECSDVNTGSAWGRK